VDAVFDEYQSKVELAKDNEKMKGKIKITDALWVFNIEDTMMLADERTMDILQKYDFLQNATHLINNPVWFESVILLNKLKPRLF
jgi:hypothetical protein